MFSKRRLIYIVNIIRIPGKYVEARLISAFETNRRLLVRPNVTVKHSFINDIDK